MLISECYKALVFGLLIMGSFSDWCVISSLIWFEFFECFKASLNVFVYERVSFGFSGSESVCALLPYLSYNEEKHSMSTNKD